MIGILEDLLQTLVGARKRSYRGMLHRELE